METNIQHLRNKLGPSFNLAKMVVDAFGKEPKDTVTNMIVRDAKQAVQNQKEITQLINDVEFETNKLRKEVQTLTSQIKKAKRLNRNLESLI